MKIIVITGSPRKDGNTFAMVDAFIKATESKGHEVFSFCVAGKDIAGKKCGIITYCDEHDPAVMDGVTMPLHRTFDLLKWNLVGEVCIPGVFQAGDINNTDGCSQAAALAESSVYKSICGLIRET